MLGLVEPFVHLEWRRVRELVEPLQRAKGTIAELRVQNDTIKEQLRREIARRTKLEEELQERERFGAENETLKDELARMRNSAEDSGRLVSSSRRLQRQQADQVLALKTENLLLRKANETTESLEAEVASLRALVCDKDVSMRRQLRTMEALKELIQRLRRLHPSVDECIDEFFQTESSEDEEQQPEPTTHKDDDEEQEAADKKRLLGARPKSGAVRVPSRSSVGQPRSVSVTSNRCSADARSASRSRMAPSPMQQLSKKRLDAISSLYLQLGTRVTVEVQGNPEPGTVKYIGPAHAGDRDDRVLVGVRLHTPLGNSDGIYKGVRHFAAPPNCGVFVRAHKVLTVFNAKKNCQACMSDCINAYMKMHQ